MSDTTTTRTRRSSAFVTPWNLALDGSFRYYEHMTTNDYELIARILHNLRHSEANAPIGSTVAWVTCDLADAFKAADPNFEHARFHDLVNRGQA